MYLVTLMPSKYLACMVHSTDLSLKGVRGNASVTSVQQARSLHAHGTCSIRKRALRVHFMTKVWSCHNTFITNPVTTKFLFLNALCLLFSWSNSDRRDCHIHLLKMYHTILPLAGAVTPLQVKSDFPVMHYYHYYYYYLQGSPDF